MAAALLTAVLGLLRCCDFSYCGARAQELWHTGLGVPWHVGSSRTRGQTHAHIDHVCVCTAVPLCCFRVMPFPPLPSFNTSSPVTCSVEPVPALVSAYFVFPQSSELTASRALTCPHCLLTSVSLGEWKLHLLLLGLLCLSVIRTLLSTVFFKPHEL